MHLSDESLTTPSAPYLAFKSNDEQKIELSSLQTNINHIERHCKSYVFAVALKDWSLAISRAEESQARAVFPDSAEFARWKRSVERLRVHPQWMLLGLESAVLSARNFGQALAAVIGLIGQIDGMMEVIDAKRLSALKKEFDAEFPRVDTARHAVVHPESIANRKKSTGPSDGETALVKITNSSDSRVVIHSNDRYTATINGQLVECLVTVENARTLIRITTECFNLFSDLDPFNAATKSKL